MCSLNVPAYGTNKDVTISFLVDRSFRSYTARSIDQSIDHAIRQMVCRYISICILWCIICFKQLMQHNKLATSNLLVASYIIFITKN